MGGVARLAAIGTAALLLAGCETGPRLGDELAGNSAEAVRTDGFRARMVFYGGGAVHVEGVAPDGPFAGDGLYGVDNRQFCFNTTERPNECMFYPSPMVPNQTADLQYQDGRRRVRFTLRRGDSAVLPPPQSAPVK